MKRHHIVPLAAAGLAVALACPPAAAAASQAPQHTSAGYDAALNSVVNPSAHRGGTIIFDNSTAPDSTDPGNTYYAYTWNTARLYGQDAGDLQVRARRGRPAAGARPGDRLGQSQRPRPGLDLPPQARHQVRRRHRSHQPGRQVRRRAQLRQGRAARRAVATSPCCSTTLPIPARTRTTHPAKWA